MEKDFKKWHGKKELIDEIKQRPFFHEREIWFCHIGLNIGFEQDGSGDRYLRPVLILRKFNNEEFLRPVVIVRKFTDKIFWGIPLTRSKEHHKINKKSEKYYYSLVFIPGVKSVAILSQIRLIDARRLARLMGMMEEKDFKMLKQKLKDLIP